MIDPVLSLASSIFVGGLFTAAGLHKLRDPVRFRATLKAYRVLPAATLGVVAPSIGLVEIVAGVSAAIVGTPLRSAGLVACLLLLCAYAGLILFSIARGNRFIDCGCLGFGARRPGLTAAMALRNLAVAVMATAALLPVDSRPLVWLDGIAVPGGVAMLALLYFGFDLVITLPGRANA